MTKLVMLGQGLTYEQRILSSFHFVQTSITQHDVNVKLMYTEVHNGCWKMDLTLSKSVYQQPIGSMDSSSVKED